jgi:hypothetical protein
LRRAESGSRQLAFQRQPLGNSAQQRGIDRTGGMRRIDEAVAQAGGLIARHGLDDVVGIDDELQPDDAQLAGAERRLRVGERTGRQHQRQRQGDSPQPVRQRPHRSIHRLRFT